MAMFCVWRLIIKDVLVLFLTSSLSLCLFAVPHCFHFALNPVCIERTHSPRPSFSLSPFFLTVTSTFPFYFSPTLG